MDTIKQKSFTVAIEGGSPIVVRRMRWKPAREFLKKLAGHFSGMRDLVDAATQSSALGASAPSLVAVLLPKLTELIVSAEDLMQHLIVYSTDLTIQGADELDWAAAVEVVRAALELNTGDELKNSFAGIAKNLGALSAVTTTNSTENSTPSS